MIEIISQYEFVIILLFMTLKKSRYYSVGAWEESGMLSENYKAYAI